MISDNLYRLIGMSFWNIDETVTCIRNHIDDFGKNSQFDLKDLVIAKMFYEAHINEIFPHPNYVTDTTILDVYIGCITNINMNYNDKSKPAKRIKDTFGIEENALLKVFLWTRDRDIGILYVIKSLCEIACEYEYDGCEVPKHLSLTINALRRRYKKNIKDGIEKFYVENDHIPVMEGYSIRDLHYYPKEDKVWE